MTEIRTPAEEHREQVADVVRVSMNLGRVFVEQIAPTLPLDSMRCAIDRDRILAVAGARGFTQWFGGREVDMSGIWGVATLPEHRGTGLASAAVRDLLQDARDHRQPISALFPATMPPYRRLGYELGGTQTKHEVRLDELPVLGNGTLVVRECDVARDVEDVRGCYRRAMAPHNGPIDSDDPDWWPTRILSHWNPDANHRAVVARGEEGVEAYASFTHASVEGDLDVAFRIECKHLVASTIDGYVSLLAYLRGFRGLGQTVRFPGPPAEPLSLLVAEQRLRPVWSHRWMLRLLDVPAAFEQRGYPAVSDEAVIAIEDDLFPENRGPWRITAEDGKVTVSEAAGQGIRPVRIGALSSMYSGFLSPFDAVRLGLMDPEDPAVPVLARLLAAEAPFMLDFF